MTYRTIFLLPIFLLCASNLSYAQWNQVGAHISSGEAQYIDFAIGKNDVLYIGYKDIGDPSGITVKKFDGNSWVSTGSINTGFWSFTMAVDGNDVPYVAAETGANTEVWRYVNGNWAQVGIPLVAQGLSHASLVIGKNDTPYLASRDDPANPNRKLSVWKFDGNAWQIVGNKSFSADIVDAGTISITIDPYGVPYVAYRDQAANGRITVKKLNGNTWASVGNDGFSNGYLIQTSIVTDNAGTPYVAYADASNNYRATVKKFDGNAWTDVGTGNFSIGPALSLTLAIDKNDTLYVAYVSGANYDSAVVQKFDGVNWVKVGYTISTGNAYQTNIAINSQGLPFIAYNDGTNGKKAVVKSFNKYAGIKDNLKH
ncbi:MAG: hypothetical protein K8F30_07780, partial [Taibaiella sp.]|nr:hypothetical protein [Taibaiella sp.]